MSDQLSALSRQFSVRRTALIALAIVAAAAAPWLSGSAYHIVLLNQALIFSLVVLGLNFVYGFGGMFSLAQAAFWGIGAYTSALLTTDAQLPFLAGLLGAALVSSLFGVLLGVPTLKLRSHYLTMATLAFAEAVRLVLMNTDWLTHGAEGVRGIPPAAIGPISFEDPYRFYYLSLAVVLAAVLFTVRFRASRLGRALQATRDDELAAGSSGVDVTYLRVLAFVLSALLAGVAGSLWAHFSAYISPETFDLFSTIRFVAMLLIGGAGTAIGPVVGAVFLTYLPEWLRFLESYYMGIYGLSIVLILIFAPRGLVGLVSRLAAPLGRYGDAETRGRGDGTEPPRHQDTKVQGESRLPLGEAWAGQRAGERGEGREGEAPAEPRAWADTRLRPGRGDVDPRESGDDGESGGGDGAPAQDGPAETPAPTRGRDLDATAVDAPPPYERALAGRCTADSVACDGDRLRLFTLGAPGSIAHRRPGSGRHVHAASDAHRDTRPHGDSALDRDGYAHQRAASYYSHDGRSQRFAGRTGAAGRDSRTGENGRASA